MGVVANTKPPYVMDFLQEIVGVHWADKEWMILDISWDAQYSPNVQQDTGRLVFDMDVHVTPTGMVHESRTFDGKVSTGINWLNGPVDMPNPATGVMTTATNQNAFVLTYRPLDRRPETISTFEYEYITQELVGAPFLEWGDFPDNGTGIAVINHPDDDAALEAARLAYHAHVDAVIGWPPGTIFFDLWPTYQKTLATETKVLTSVLVSQHFRTLMFVNVGAVRRHFYAQPLPNGSVFKLEFTMPSWPAGLSCGWTIDYYTLKSKDNKFPVDLDYNPMFEINAIDFGEITGGEHTDEGGVPKHTTVTLSLNLNDLSVTANTVIST